MTQQLVARIKRSSKYFYQSPPDQWFAVHAVFDRLTPWRGNRTSDLAFGARLNDGTVVEITSRRRK